jgi:hypothetical protein
MNKIIIFDASTLITFAMNGLFEEFRNLKKIFNGKFIITSQIKREIIDKPLTIKRFELEALRLKQFLDEKILELPSSLNIDEKEILEETNLIMDKSNTLFNEKDKKIHLIDLGEASALALSKILTKQNLENVLAVDERTTRMLCEKPEDLKKIFQKKLHTKIDVKKEDYKFFKGFQFIRSAELVYVIYKKKLTNLKNPLVLDALLYAVKFKGCSISEDEIQEIKKIG